MDAGASRVHRLLLARPATVAVAESLTGGALAASITAVPGVSATFLGGVVAYATGVKDAVLGVDRALLDRVGPVDPEVARQMAAGVRDLLGATYGVATTGVAGPDPQDGHPVGEVHVAVAGPARVVAESLHVPGDRREIRAVTVARALALLAGELGRDASV